MSNQLHVHNLFMWSMAVIYLFAFASLYHQLPGLYGDKGILPVATLELPAKTPKLDLAELFRTWFNVKPTLLWITKSLGLDTQTSLDVLASLGILLSSLAIVTKFARNFVIFGALWLLYLSFTSVGSVFLWFQWDALLLEAGFLTFVFAPIPLFMPSRIHNKLAGIAMWPVKWLFFRLMFMSGIVKLLSGCPTWWKLTALHHHYESQCIPTFIAWYVHQLPGWFDQLSVLHALFSECVVPFLFFAPTKGLRKFAFYNQLLLQLGIIITGNYNWFNLLAVVLSLSLLEDEDLGFSTFKKKFSSKVKGFFMFLLNTAVVLGLMASCLYLWDVRYDEKKIFLFKSSITESDIHHAMQFLWPFSVAVAAASFVFHILRYFYNQREHRDGSLTKFYRGIFLGFYLVAASGLFALSLSPYSSINKRINLGEAGLRLRSAHQQLDKFSIVNGYGLFRRMTGVEGRPELILEGSDDLESGWKPYEFIDKPGRLDKAPPFVIPHQPRLDWQMWFAALGDPNSSRWVYNLIYRLLQGQNEVLRLLDPSTPFYKKPPKYIRGQLYKYWFTTLEDKDPKTGNVTSNWWKRKFEREWLSPTSLNDENLKKVVEQQGLDRSVKSPVIKNDWIGPLLNVTKQLRLTSATVSAPVFIWSLFMVNVVFHRMLKALRM